MCHWKMKQLQTFEEISFINFIYNHPEKLRQSEKQLKGAMVTVESSQRSTTQGISIFWQNKSIWKKAKRKPSLAASHTNSRLQFATRHTQYRASIGNKVPGSHQIVSTFSGPDAKCNVWKKTNSAGHSEHPSPQINIMVAQSFCLGYFSLVEKNGLYILLIQVGFQISNDKKMWKTMCPSTLYPYFELACHPNKMHWSCNLTKRLKVQESFGRHCCQKAGLQRSLLLHLSFDIPWLLVVIFIPHSQFCVHHTAFFPTIDFASTVISSLLY